MQPEAVNVMVLPAVAPVDLAAESRWLAWKARGAEVDRRSSTRMRQVFAILFAILVVWLSLQVL